MKFPKSLLDSALRSKEAYMKIAPIGSTYHTSRRTGADAYSYVDGNKVLFAFRGTKGIQDLLTNGDLRQGVHYVEKGQPLYAHQGFINQYNSIERSIMKVVESNEAASEIVFTGHSLGAALATLAASKISVETDAVIKLHTFGSPRVGCEGFADWTSYILDEHFRITHRQDPITRVPFSWRFKHVTGKAYEYDDDLNIKILEDDAHWIWRLVNIYNTFDVAKPIDDHDMNNYIKCVESTL